MTSKFESLFSPLKIGPVEIPNRIAMMPMGVFSPRLLNMETIAYTKEGADYYIERAKGGTGLIITGLMPVVNNMGFCILSNPEGYVRDMKYLMDGVHEAGGKVFVQLTALTGRANHGLVGICPDSCIHPKRLGPDKNRYVACRKKKSKNILKTLPKEQNWF